MRRAIALATVLLTACSQSTVGSGSLANVPIPRGHHSSGHQVIFQLSGSATRADLTFQAGADQSQQQHVLIPIINKSGSSGLRFNNVVDGDFLYFSAQNDGGGTITCQITEDGAVIASNTSSGRYAIATCSASA